MKVIIIGILGIFLSTTVALAADCTEKFSWLQNSEEDIGGYKIHYGLSDGGPYPNAVDIVSPTPVNELILGEVPGLICGNYYYFVATAYKILND